jgi:S1-C subfamily serine protease
MALSHKTGIVTACAALCLLHAPAFADDRKSVAMPPRPEAGASSKAPLPALGNLSGVGKASAGLPPARVEEAVRKAQDDRADLLRTRKRDNTLDVYGKSVVLVVTPDKLGSATLVESNGTFVTSWHILRDHAQVGVIFMPENRDRRLTEADAVTATVVRTDPSRDLALLEVPDRPRGMKPVRLALKHIPATGSSLSILGHPYGEIWSLSQGTLAKVIAGHAWQSETGTQHRADVIRFRSRTATGNAGGPVLDAKGRFLAVDVQRTDDKTLTSIGVTAGEVAHLLATPPPSAMMAPSPRQAQVKSCEPQRLGTSRTRGDDGTVHTLDLNCNGKPDALMLVPDNTKSGNHLANDANENGVTDSVYFDFNRDGRFDEVRFDTDEDGKADLLGTELDSELIPRNTRVLPK